jgi:hypothetical protein
MRCHPLSYGLGLSAIRAAAARNGLDDLDLFACTGVLNKVPDVDDAIGAGVGAIMISGGWVRWVRGRLLCGHEALLRGPRLREIRPSAEASYVISALIIS